MSKPPDIASPPNSAGVLPHSDETRRAIVAAAIQEIAAHGVEGASLRAINVAAGSKNASAAHYHFGSKAALIEAGLRHVMAHVSASQEPLLAALEERTRFGRPVGVREVVEAVYLPYFALLTAPGLGPTAVKFISRVLIESNDELQAIVNELVTPIMQRCLALLRAGAPQVPEETLKLRILITITNAVHGAGDFAAMSNSPFGDMSGGNPAVLVHGMFDYLTAAIVAPPTSFTAADEARMAATLFPS